MDDWQNSKVQDTYANTGHKFRVAEIGVNPAKTQTTMLRPIIHFHPIIFAKTFD